MGATVSDAKIPQVKHTLGFRWTQTLAPEGSNFSDGFVNEEGVVVVSINFNVTIEKDQKVNDGCIGYSIRRIFAERVNSAREGVDIVIDLMKKYGYFHMGRTYTIADRNEAWQISLLRGHRYLARKVGDNEIAFIANAFAFDKVDLKDPNVIASPDLIEHSIEMDAYKPAKAGDYSDFSFREAYQPEDRRVFPRNKERAFTLLEMVTGKEYKDTNDYPAYLPAPKKYTVEDIQTLMRGHSKFEKRESAGIMKPCRTSATSARSTPWCSSLQRIRCSPWLGVRPDVRPNSSTRRHSRLPVLPWLRRI